MKTMMGEISNHLFPLLCEFVTQRMGLHFPQNRWNDLERGMIAAAHEFGFVDMDSCIQWLLSSPVSRNQIEILASYLTIGETYFFREKRSLDIFETKILPELIHSRLETDLRLRFWSAGCCTGEEPYSIAILVNKVIPNWNDWNITILATDINPHFLQKASMGIYKNWSFRDTPNQDKERYFQKNKEDLFEISPDIKKRVAFSYLNLVEDVYPSLSNSTNAMDAIFCRNVLMYFSPERQQQVIRNLYSSLVEGGWLIVSSCEVSQVIYSQFETVNFEEGTFYRKTSNRQSKKIIFEFPLPEIDSSSTVSGYPKFNSESKPEGSWPAETKESLTVEPKCHEPDVPPQTMYQEARHLYELGQYFEVIEKLETGLLENPDNTDAIALLSRAYANQGQLNKALDWCKKAIILDKLNPAHHFLQAIIRQENGEIEEALTSLNVALYLDPQFILAYFTLGNLNQNLGKFKESEKYFKNTLVLLNPLPLEEVLPESEGITAGRLKEIIQSNLSKDIVS